MHMPFEQVLTVDVDWDCVQSNRANVGSICTKSQIFFKVVG